MAAEAAAASGPATEEAPPDPNEAQLRAYIANLAAMPRSAHTELARADFERQLAQLEAAKATKSTGSGHYLLLRARQHVDRKQKHFDTAERAVADLVSQIEALQEKLDEARLAVVSAKHCLQLAQEQERKLLEGAAAAAGVACNDEIRRGLDGLRLQAEALPGAAQAGNAAVAHAAILHQIESLLARLPADSQGQHHPEAEEGRGPATPTPPAQGPQRAKSASRARSAVRGTSGLRSGRASGRHGTSPQCTQLDRRSRSRGSDDSSFVGTADRSDMEEAGEPMDPPPPRCCSWGFPRGHTWGGGHACGDPTVWVLRVAAAQGGSRCAARSSAVPHFCTTSNRRAVHGASMTLAGPKPRCTQRPALLCSMFGGMCRPRSTLCMFSLTAPRPRHALVLRPAHLCAAGL